MRKTIDIANVEFASFPQRIAARIFDNIIVFLLFLGFLALNGETLSLDAEKIDSNLGVGNLIWFLPLFALAYEIPLMATYGLTLGKRLMGVCVVRTDGIIGIGLDRALIRFLTPLPFSIIPLVGPFVALGAQAWFVYDPKRQNIPDKAARTFVIRIPRVEPDESIEPDVSEWS